MKNDFSYNKGFSLKNEKNFILSSESLTNIFSDPYFYEKHCKLVKKIFGRNTHILIVLKKPSDLFKSIYLENNFLNHLKKEINYSISYSSEIFHKSISGSSLNFLIKFEKFLNNLNLSLDVNGERRQTGNTKRMIFNFNFLISHISQFMTLYPGTIITTGTPAGTAMEMDVPKFLQPGDKLSLTVDQLGEQNHKVEEGD